MQTTTSVPSSHHPILHSSEYNPLLCRYLPIVVAFRLSQEAAANWYIVADFARQTMFDMARQREQSLRGPFGAVACSASEFSYMCSLRPFF